VAECNHADEMIRWLANFPDVNPNPIAGTDPHGIIACANSATQKNLKERGFKKNPPLYFADDKDEILHSQKESTEFKIYGELSRNTAYVPENIPRLRELQNVNFCYTLFYQTCKEEITRHPGENLAIGTGNREGD